MGVIQKLIDASPEKNAATLLAMIPEGVDQMVDGKRCIGIQGMTLMDVVSLIRAEGIELPIFRGINIHELDAYQDMLEDDEITPYFVP